MANVETEFAACTKPTFASDERNGPVSPFVLFVACRRHARTSSSRVNLASARNAALWVSFLFPAFAVAGLREGYQIPAGTILPVSLNSALSSAKCKPGQMITARVIQNVPLPDREVLRAGTKVIGHIVSVTSVLGESPASLSFRFDTLETRHGRVSVITSLRAIASFMAVQQAQLPRAGADRGTPENAWTTVQIGGDIVYRGGGYVEAHRERVGKPVPGGVLSRLQSNPERGCAGALDTSEARQALWLFSSDACGTYDLPNLRIRRTEGPNSSGEIILDSAKGQVNVRAGAGLLLAVNSASGA
jgi:hypothetical protein